MFVVVLERPWNGIASVSNPALHGLLSLGSNSHSGWAKGTPAPSELCIEIWKSWMLVNRLGLAILTFQFGKELNLNSGMEKKCSTRQKKLSAVSL